MSKCSIGGYHLKNYKKLNGLDSEGYSANLYKGDLFVASIEDRADGGESHIHFYKSELAPEVLLLDLQQLLSHLTPILHKNGLYTMYNRTTYGAVNLFSELWLELRELVKTATKAVKESTAGNLYYVGALGGSWFSGLGVTGITTTFYYCTKTNDYAKAQELAKAYALEHREKYGQLTALAILDGEIDWNLDFQSYAELYMP